MSIRQQIFDVENSLMEARIRARQAAEAKETEGVKNFQKWVNKATAPKFPNITGLDSLITFTAQALFNAGVKYAGDYFDMAQNDVPVLEKHLKDLQADAEELGIDDENEV